MAKLIEENKALLPSNMPDEQNTPDAQDDMNAQNVSDNPAAQDAAKQEKPLEIPKKPRCLQKLPKMSKLFNLHNKKRLIAIGASVLVLIIVAVLVFNSDGNRYKRALSDFEKGKYEVAQEKFIKLGDYEESAMWAADSAVMINVDACVESKNYYEALSLMNSLAVSSDQMNKLKHIINAKRLLKIASDKISTSYPTVPAGMKESYEGALCSLYKSETNKEYTAFGTSSENIDSNTAKKYYEKCRSSDNDEVVTLSENAKSGIEYAEACNLFAQGKYDKAAKKYKVLGEFENASKMITVCSSTKKEKAKAYKEGVELLKNKKYYQAYNKFHEAEPYDDAAAQTQKCKRDLPQTGDYKKSGGGSVSLTISAPSSGTSNNTYLKMYDSSQKLVGSVFIRQGESSTVSLPSGTITIKVAYGGNWWGEDDMFGDEGAYELLTNEGKDVFTLNAGSYSLKLKTATTNGNVGSNSVDRGSF